MSPMCQHHQNKSNPHHTPKDNDAVNHTDLPNWPAWDNIEGKDKVLVLDADFTDLRLSYSSETITVQDVLNLVNSELEEPERGKVLTMLEDFIPFKE